MKDTVSQAISSIKDKGIVLLVDDTEPNGFAFLLASAASITEKDVSFLVNVSGGVICAALYESRINELGLSMMTSNNSASGPDFATSVEARSGVTTGISAADRARTLKVLATTKDPRFDLVMPGHIFPMRAKKGGVLVRNTIAEAAADLMTFASVPPIAALTQCLNGKGEPLNKKELDTLQKEHNLVSLSISDIVKKRLTTESLVEEIAEAKLPTKKFGTFRAICFKSIIDNVDHLALIKGALPRETHNNEPILVRVQAENRVGDILGTGNAALQSRGVIYGALKAIAKEERGIFVYVRHPKAGLLAKQLLQKQTSSNDTNKLSALRELGVGAQILTALGAHSIKLLTNSSREIAGTEAFGLSITERIPFEPFPRDSLDVFSGNAIAVA